MSSNLNQLRAARYRTNFLARPVAYVVTSLLLLASVGVTAEEAARNAAPKDRYRVELLLFSLKDPADQEYLGQADLPSIPLDSELLFGERPEVERNQSSSEPASQAEPIVGEQAPTDTRTPKIGNFSQTLLPTGNLRLTSARKRLENSGRYEIEFHAAWNEGFPPGHKTPPLLVRVGESEDGYSDIEGYIQIERQRYLHVTAQLYDLDLDPDTSASGKAEGPESLPREAAAIFGGTDIEPLLLDFQTAPLDLVPADPGPEIVSWMRETRRMRSKEVHFLDSPTMGLLVYFEPLD